MRPSRPRPEVRRARFHEAHKWFALAATIAPLCIARNACADDVPPAPPVSAPLATAIETKQIERSYWWQTVAFDGAALALLMTGAGAQEMDIFGPAALGTYLVGAPAVHFAHGSTGRALGSIGLRLGVPTASAFIGGLLATGYAKPSSNDSCCSDEAHFGTIYGALAGAAIASTLDATVLAEEKVEVPRSSDAGLVRAWSPAVGIGPQQATIGVQGTLF